MKKFAIAALAWLCGLASIWAQGSLYSIYGVGDLARPATSQAAAMGAAGVAALSPFYINPINPATLSAVTATRISGEVLYEGYAATGNLRSTYQTLMNFAGAGFAVPIWKAVFSTGLYPYSRLNYNQKQTGTRIIPEVDTTDFTYIYRGLGGLNFVPISLGMTVFNNKFKGTLRFGASANFIFGSFQRESENEFTDARLSSSIAIREERASGTTFTLGGAYTKQHIFSRTDELTLGATFTTATNLSGVSERFVLNNNLDDGGDTLQNGDGNISLPTTIGIGLAYRGNQRYVILADLLIQNWSTFRYFGDETDFARNTLRIGVGGEYQGVQERRASLFARATLRAGVYLNQTYLQFQEIGGVNELGFTAGFSIPITNDFSRLDVNIDYAMRGKTSAAFVSENIVRVRVALNAGELWFQKRKIE